MCVFQDEERTCKAGIKKLDGAGRSGHIHEQVVANLSDRSENKITARQ